MNSAFFSKIEPDSIVLTPNRRLARYCLARYESWNIEQGQLAWPTPKILPIEDWLEELWLSLERPEIKLSNFEMLQCWELAILNSPLSEEILNVNAAAKVAKQAWTYLCHWRKSLKQIQELNNPETQAFSEWAHSYLKICAAIPAVDAHQLVEELINHSQNLCLPKTIYLLSFDEIIPLHQTFLNTTQANLITIQSKRSAQLKKFAAKSTLEEIKTMLRWVKKIHEAEPQARITCIIPKLAELRSELVWQVNRLFFPGALVNSDFTQSTINISGGYGLNQASIIQGALMLLQLPRENIDYSTLSALLSCRYLKDASNELTHWALINTHLNQLDEPTLKWSTVFHFSRQKIKDLGCSDSLILMLEQALEYISTLSRKQTCAQWREHFLTILAIFDWPGSANLSSLEYQQVEHFYEALDLFANNNVQHILSFSDAKKLFHELIKQIIFQVKTINGPIQILGLLEAGGLESDYIWLMGLDSLSWPASASPNPFIPLHLQKSWNLPHSSAERERIFAKKLQEDFARSCHTFMLSYAQFEGDRELQASPLLKSIPDITLEELDLSEITYPENIATAEFEYFEDWSATPIETTELIGGTSILKSQANCPFQAFASYRLNADKPQTPELHISATKRGELLHDVLNNIWQSLGTQKKLLEKTEIELAILVECSILQALKNCLPHYSQKYSSGFKKLETIRLKQLLLEWLALEKSRANFTVIAHEEKRQIELNGALLNLRVDRIDKLDDGSLLLIDYKTSEVRLARWYEERITEPQLPLYCVSDPQIKGASFAQIRANKKRWLGIAQTATEIPGIELFSSEDWQALVLLWHKNLSALMQEFQMGLAIVTPSLESCTHCDIKSLCRHSELEEELSA